MQHWQLSRSFLSSWYPCFVKLRWHSSLIPWKPIFVAACLEQNQKPSMLSLCPRYTISCKNTVLISEKHSVLSYPCIYHSSAEKPLHSLSQLNPRVYFLSVKEKLAQYYSYLLMLYTYQVFDVQVQCLIPHEKIQHVIVLTLDGDKRSTELPTLHVVINWITLISGSNDCTFSWRLRLAPAFRRELATIFFSCRVANINAVTPVYIG